jgi:hypothetical protein
MPEKMVCPLPQLALLTNKVKKTAAMQVKTKAYS